MICKNCRSTKVVSEIGVHHYVESGLKNLYLENVEILRCQDCGSKSVRIPALQGLHLAIAEMIATSEAALSGREIRFLRKWLGWTGRDFAERVRVECETVSRWENEKVSIPGAVESHLRGMTLVNLPNRSKYLGRFEDLTNANRQEQPRNRIRMHLQDEKWRQEGLLC